jgi:hypothetical protein
MRNRSALWILAAVTAGTALADDAVDMKVNPQNSYVEEVRSEYVASSYDIRLLISQGLDTDPTVYYVSTNAADDRSPRVEISPAGDTWITWWRDLATDEVRVREFQHASQTLGADRLVSQSTENARNPEIVYDGATPWVVYEVHGGSSKSIAVAHITDEPDPVGPGVTLRTTSYGGNMDARIHHASGHLWVTWVDGTSDVGWSEYDTGEESWSAAAYESYSGSTVGAARQAIRNSVLEQ